MIENDTGYKRQLEQIAHKIFASYGWIYDIDADFPAQLQKLLETSANVLEIEKELKRIPSQILESAEFSRWLFCVCESIGFLGSESKSGVIARKILGKYTKGLALVPKGENQQLQNELFGYYTKAFCRVYDFVLVGRDNPSKSKETSGILDTFNSVFRASMMNLAASEFFGKELDREGELHKVCCCILNSVLMQAEGYFTTINGSLWKDQPADVKNGFPNVVPVDILSGGTVSFQDAIAQVRVLALGYLFQSGFLTGIKDKQKIGKFFENFSSVGDFKSGILNTAFSKLKSKVSNKSIEGAIYSTFSKEVQGKGGTSWVESVDAYVCMRMAFEELFGNEGGGYNKHRLSRLLEVFARSRAAMPNVVKNNYICTMFAAAYFMLSNTRKVVDKSWVVTLFGMMTTYDLNAEINAATSEHDRSTSPHRVSLFLEEIDAVIMERACSAIGFVLLPGSNQEVFVGVGRSFFSGFLLQNNQDGPLTTATLGAPLSKFLSIICEELEKKDLGKVFWTELLEFAESSKTPIIKVLMEGLKMSLKDEDGRILSKSFLKHGNDLVEKVLVNHLKYSSNDNDEISNEILARGFNGLALGIGFYKQDGDKTKLLDAFGALLKTPVVANRFSEIVGELCSTKFSNEMRDRIKPFLHLAYLSRAYKEEKFAVNEDTVLFKEGDDANTKIDAIISASQGVFQFVQNLLQETRSVIDGSEDKLADIDTVAEDILLHFCKKGAEIILESQNRNLMFKMYKFLDSKDLATYDLEKVYLQFNSWSGSFVSPNALESSSLGDGVRKSSNQMMLGGLDKIADYVVQCIAEVAETSAVEQDDSQLYVEQPVSKLTDWFTREVGNAENTKLDHGARTDLVKKVIVGVCKISESATDDKEQTLVDIVNNLDRFCLGITPILYGKDGKISNEKLAEFARSCLSEQDQSKAVIANAIPKIAAVIRKKFSKSDSLAVIEKVFINLELEVNRMNNQEPVAIDLYMDRVNAVDNNDAMGHLFDELVRCGVKCNGDKIKDLSERHPASFITIINTSANIDGIGDVVFEASKKSREFGINLVKGLNKDRIISLLKHFDKKGSDAPECICKMFLRVLRYRNDIRKEDIAAICEVAIKHMDFASEHVSLFWEGSLKKPTLTDPDPSFLNIKANLVALVDMVASTPEGVSRDDSGPMKVLEFFCKATVLNIYTTHGLARFYCLTVLYGHELPSNIDQWKETSPYALKGERLRILNKAFFANNHFLPEKMKGLYRDMKEAVKKDEGVEYLTLRLDLGGVGPDHAYQYAVVESVKGALSFDSTLQELCEVYKATAYNTLPSPGYDKSSFLREVLRVFASDFSKGAIDENQFAWIKKFLPPMLPSGEFKTLDCKDPNIIALEYFLGNNKFGIDPFLRRAILQEEGLHKFHQVLEANKDLFVNMKINDKSSLYFESSDWSQPFNMMRDLTKMLIDIDGTTEVDCRVRILEFFLENAVFNKNKIKRGESIVGALVSGLSFLEFGGSSIGKPDVARAIAKGFLGYRQQHKDRVSSSESEQGTVTWNDTAFLRPAISSMVEDTISIQRKADALSLFEESGVNLEDAIAQEFYLKGTGVRRYIEDEPTQFGSSSDLCGLYQFYTFPLIRKYILMGTKIGDEDNIVAHKLMDASFEKLLIMYYGYSEKVAQEIVKCGNKYSFMQDFLSENSSTNATAAGCVAIHLLEYCQSVPEVAEEKLDGPKAAKKTPDLTDVEKLIFSYEELVKCSVRDNDYKLLLKLADRLQNPDEITRIKNKIYGDDASSLYSEASTDRSHTRDLSFYSSLGAISSSVQSIAHYRAYNSLAEVCLQPVMHSLKSASEEGTFNPDERQEFVIGIIGCMIFCRGAASPNDFYGFLSHIKLFGDENKDRFPDVSIALDKFRPAFPKMTEIEKHKFISLSYICAKRKFCILDDGARAIDVERDLINSTLRLAQYNGVDREVFSSIKLGIRRFSNKALAIFAKKIKKENKLHVSSIFDYILESFNEESRNEPGGQTSASPRVRQLGEILAHILPGCMEYECQKAFSMPIEGGIATPSTYMKYMKFLASSDMARKSFLTHVKNFSYSMLESKVSDLRTKNPILGLMVDAIAAQESLIAPGTEDKVRGVLYGSSAYKYIKENSKFQGEYNAINTILVLVSFLQKDGTEINSAGSEPSSHFHDDIVLRVVSGLDISKSMIAINNSVIGGVVNAMANPTIKNIDSVKKAALENSAIQTARFFGIAGAPKFTIDLALKRTNPTLYRRIQDSFTDGRMVRERNTQVSKTLFLEEAFVVMAALGVVAGVITITLNHYSVISLSNRYFYLIIGATIASLLCAVGLIIFCCVTAKDRLIKKTKYIVPYGDESLRLSDNSKQIEHVNADEEIGIEIGIEIDSSLPPESLVSEYEDPGEMQVLSDRTKVSDVARDPSNRQYEADTVDSNIANVAMKHVRSASVDSGIPGNLSLPRGKQGFVQTQSLSDFTSTKSMVTQSSQSSVYSQEFYDTSSLTEPRRKDSSSEETVYSSANDFKVHVKEDKDNKGSSSIVVQADVHNVDTDNPITGMLDHGTNNSDVAVSSPPTTELHEPEVEGPDAENKGKIELI